MSVCLHSCLGHPACKSHLFCAVLYCCLWPFCFYQIFPFYLLKATIIGKMFLNVQCVFLFYI